MKARFNSLNRTFYGIETYFKNKDFKTQECLNRTFYGIETKIPLPSSKIILCLNRTFYGIETKKTTAQR